MSVAGLALTAAKGEAVTYNATHQTSASDTTAVNITGWTIAVTARDETKAVVLTKAASVVSGAAGTYTWSVTKADTSLQAKSYNLDIQRTDSGSEKLMGLGTWTILQEVLYP